MRKVIFSINITLDGCVDHTKGNGTEEVHEYFTELMYDADLFVYGRKLYQLMVPYWPEVAKNKSGSTKATNDFARVFSAVKKVVFSRTLDSVDDEMARIVRTNPEDELRRLKQEEGKSILLGGVNLPSQLVYTGLIDEYRFVVQPIIAGEGTRLFDVVSLPEKLQLKLVETTVFKDGNVALRYVK